MSASKQSDLARAVSDFVLDGFHPRYGQARPTTSNPLWQRLSQLGSELWLDSGNIRDISQVWTAEFTALTTNNTLLNKEIQSGAYDRTIAQATDVLDDFPQLSPQQRLLEIAFILNARHGLKLVEQFDAMVSVEEHTALAHDVDAAVATGRRYFDICPERFIVKLPLTPAGLLATRRLSDHGVAVNHTLGFSARQAYLAAALGRPRYVNVFLGRLNQLAVDNHLGDGQYVGEKATLAAQAAVRELRQRHNVPTRQIAASFRSGAQVRDLGGVDVLTIPPKVAGEFLELGVGPRDLSDRTQIAYEPHLPPQAAELGFATLWDISAPLRAAVDELAAADLHDMQPRALVKHLAQRSAGDVLVEWSPQQAADSRSQGKIPPLEKWRDLLASGRVGLDAVMNLAGLQSFAQDQQAMDDRVADVLHNQARSAT
jgi:transaldolase